MKKLVYILLGIVLVSCNYFNPPTTENAIARVGESYLYKEDIED